MRRLLIHGVGCMVMFLLVILPAYAAESTAHFWSTPFCEFGVVFPAEPHEYQSFVQPGQSADRIKMPAAQLETDGLYRAECVVMPEGYLGIFTEEDHIGVMEVMADAWSLGVRSYNVQEYPGYVVATVYGYSETEWGRATVEITNYMASRSMFSLTRAQLSQDWQSDSMRTFKQSVRKTNR